MRLEENPWCRLGPSIRKDAVTVLKKVHSAIPNWSLSKANRAKRAQRRPFSRKNRKEHLKKVQMLEFQKDSSPIILCESNPPRVSRAAVQGE
jgi:hypothetical protein